MRWHRQLVYGGHYIKAKNSEVVQQSLFVGIAALHHADFKRSGMGIGIRQHAANNGACHVAATNENNMGLGG
ncbi:MAG: hypothetical protein QMC46_07635 [Burkholderiaceae bacterium]